MSCENFIYGLSCTCHPEKGIRYVGQTRRPWWARKASYKHGHLKKNDKGQWQYTQPVMSWMRKHGFENVAMTPIDTTPSMSWEQLNDAEIYWISHYRSLGLSDLNLTDGGEGAPGYEHTDDAKRKMRSRVYTEETKARMSASARERIERIGPPKHENHPRGESAYMASTDDATVLEIKKALAAGGKYAQIAEQFGVSKQLVSKVYTGRSWAHVPWPEGFTPARKTRPAMDEDVKRTVIERLLAGDLSTVIARELNVHRGSVSQVRRELGLPDGRGSKARLRDVSERTAGASNPMSKLTEDMVREMRRRRALGEGYESIAKDFPISETGASMACRGVTWKHVV